MKELTIRNSYDGMIWQVYHVKNPTEVELLTRPTASDFTR